MIIRDEDDVEITDGGERVTQIPPMSLLRICDGIRQIPSFSSLSQVGLSLSFVPPRDFHGYRSLPFANQMERYTTLLAANAALQNSYDNLLSAYQALQSAHTSAQLDNSTLLFSTSPPSTSLPPSTPRRLTPPPLNSHVDRPVFSPIPSVPVPPPPTQLQPEPLGVIVTPLIPDGHVYDQNHEFSPALSTSNLDDSYFLVPFSSPPATPSYRGSPRTACFDPGFDESFVVLGDDPRDYDPTKYDTPSNRQSPLPNFMNPYASLPPPAVGDGFDNTSNHTSHPSADKPSSPSQETPVPSSSILPDAPASINAENLHRVTPLISASQGDGGIMNGPRLHIVPATPVPREETVLFTGAPLESTFFSPSPPFISIALTFCTGPAPPTRNTGEAPQNIPFDAQINSDFNNMQSNTLDHYLVHHQQRARSKSDTSTRPPTWDIMSFDPSPSNGRTHVNLNDVPPSTSPQPLGYMLSSTDPHQSGFSNPSLQPGLPNHYSFAGKSQAGFQYLDPEPPITITIRRPEHHHSRSEGGFTFPQPAHLGFIDHTAPSNSDTGGHQFSYPTEIPPDITRGHQQRSSSDSMDRSITRMGLHSAPGNTLTSPDPSLNASPSLSFDPLPPIPNLQSITDPSGMGRGRPVSMPAYGGSAYGIPPGSIKEFGRQLNVGGGLSQMGPPLSSKPAHGTNSSASSVTVGGPKVTTTATAEASERRRKADANFYCPVPGCGSTFTRHFNLKGALLSFT